MRLSPLILRCIRLLFVFYILHQIKRKSRFAPIKRPTQLFVVLVCCEKDFLQKIIKKFLSKTHSLTNSLSRARVRARGLLACFVLVLYLVFTCFRCPQTQ